MKTYFKLILDEYCPKNFFAIYFLLVNFALYVGEGVYAQTVVPVDYWNFNLQQQNSFIFSNQGSSLPAQSGNLVIFPTPTTTPLNWINNSTTNPLNGALLFSSDISHVYAYKNSGSINNTPWAGVASPTPSPTKGSFEFLMNSYGLQRSLVIESPFGLIYWEPHRLNFEVNISQKIHKISVPFNNIDRLSPGYYFSNGQSNWHHIAITVETYVATYNQKTADVNFWVDGKKIHSEEVMWDIIERNSNGKISVSTISPGSYIEINYATSAGSGIQNTYPSGFYFEGELDDIAMYDVVMPDWLIYQHYYERLVANPITDSYSFTQNPNIQFPASYVFVPSVVFDPLDAPEEAENKTIKTQLYKCPLPRYKPDHGLLRNAFVSAWNYDKYAAANGVTPHSAENLGLFNSELAQKWNYYLSANTVFSPDDIASNPYGTLREQANHPNNIHIPIAYSFAQTTKVVPLGGPCQVGFDPYDPTRFYTYNHNLFVSNETNPKFTFVSVPSPSPVTVDLNVINNNTSPPTITTNSKAIDVGKYHYPNDCNAYFTLNINNTNPLEVTVDLAKTAVSTFDGQANFVTCNIDWGDNSSYSNPTPPSTPLSHVYTQSGPYKIVLDIEDSKMCKSQMTRFVNTATNNVTSFDYQATHQRVQFFNNSTNSNGGTSGLTYSWKTSRDIMSLPMKQEPKNIFGPQYAPNKVNGDADWVDLGEKAHFTMVNYWTNGSSDCDHYNTTSSTPEFHEPFSLIIDNDEVTNINSQSKYYNRNSDLGDVNNVSSNSNADYQNWLSTTTAPKNIYNFDSETRFYRYKSIYKNVIMGSSNAVNANTKFTAYRSSNYWSYRYLRNYVSPFNYNYKGSQYSSDYGIIRNYTPNPYDFAQLSLSVGREIVEACNEDITDPVNFFASWYSFSRYLPETNGWDWSTVPNHNEIKNIDLRSTRPATALGYAKYLGILGSEFGFSYLGRPGCDGDVQNCADNPNALIWQAMTLSYAQAIISRYEDVFREGKVMEGTTFPSSGYGSTFIPNTLNNVDGNTSIPYNVHTKYLFDTHDNRIVVGARKVPNQAKYVIATSILNWGNNVELGSGGTVIKENTPKEATTEFTLDSDLRLKIKTRRQGSVYYLDNTTPSLPKFYQLDGWHESSHPSYWSKNFYIEAELYDNITINGTVSPYFMRTYVSPGNALIFNSTNTIDLTNAYTVIFPNYGHTTYYNFEPRSEEPNKLSNYMLKIRAAKGGNGCNMLDVNIINSNGTITPLNNPITINTGSNNQMMWTCINHPALQNLTPNKNYTISLKKASSCGTAGSFFMVDAIELVDFDIAFNKSTTYNTDCFKYEFKIENSDNCNSILSYSWNFGDPNGVNNMVTINASPSTPIPIVEHTFSEWNAFTVTCTLALAGGNSMIITKQIDVEMPDIDFIAEVASVPQNPSYNSPNSAQFDVDCSYYNFKPLLGCFTTTKKLKWVWNFNNPNTGPGPSTANFTGCNGNWGNPGFPHINPFTSNLQTIAYYPNSPTPNNPPSLLNYWAGVCPPSSPPFPWDKDNSHIVNNQVKRYCFYDIYHMFDQVNANGTRIYEFDVTLSVIDLNNKLVKSVTKRINTQKINGNCPLPINARSSANNDYASNETSENINTQLKPLNISLVPNPTEEDVTLSISFEKATSYQITVVDILGRKIWENNFYSELENKEILIPAQNFSKGLYFVSVFTGNNYKTLKLIKE